MVQGLMFGLIAAAVSAAIYPSLHKSGFKKRLRKFNEEKLGKTGPFICEVELSSVGVCIRETNKQTTYEWKSIEQIEETGDSVGIFTQDGGGVIVRKKAFRSPEEQEQFKQLAQNYFESSRIDGS